MATIPILRKWRNGDIINARDYVYERDLIVNLVNEHDQRIAVLEAYKNTSESQITTLISTVSNHEGRIVTLEDFKDDVEQTVSNHEGRIVTLEDFKDDVEQKVADGYFSEIIVSDTEPPNLLVGGFWYDIL
jgi:F420-0:gamma-glutamyl ligase